MSKYMEQINLFQDAKENRSFRRVVFTGKHSQIALMSLKPDEDVEWGIIKSDKIILVISGQGQATVRDDERPVGEGDLVFVGAGVKHDLVNTGEGDLKLAMVYAPSIYPEETVHSTKAKAIMDPFSDHSGV